MEVDNVYQYTELQGTDAIRLIYLQPYKDLEAGVEFSLKDASLKEYGNDIGGYYTAISYVWGDQNDARSILVDGKYLNITASLDSALRHKDVQDRNRQVRLMGDIYSTAQRTIIFLGSSSPNCDAVFRLMKSKPLGALETPQRHHSFERNVEDEILSKPWFTRVWILQELVLSQNPWLQCGRHRLDWEVFSGHVLTSRTLLWRPDSRAILTNMYISQIKFRRGRHERQPKPNFPEEALFQILRSRRGCGLSDPRDMVYAHLGLVSHEMQAKFPVDYNKSVVHLYQDIATLCLEQRGLKFALSLVDHVQPEDRPSHLPSWITDWSTPCPAGALTPINFESSDMSKQPSYLNCSWTVPGTLAVLGHDCGTVDRTISMSTWPEGLFGQSFSVNSAMQWLSQSDDESVMCRQSLVDLVAQHTPGEHDEVILTDFFQDPHWAEVASRMCLLVPSHIGPEDTNASSSRVQGVVNACLGTLSFLLPHGKSRPHVAVLESGVMVNVPELARRGDILVGLPDPDVPDSSSTPFYIVLRSQNTHLPLEIPAELTYDLSEKDVVSFEVDGRKQYQVYTFVAGSTTIKKLDLRSFSATTIEKSEKKKIFALI